jgi:hypothetical protein
MRSRILFAGLFACILLGCEKKSAKFTGSANDAVSTPTNARASPAEVASATTAAMPVSQNDMNDIWLFIDARSGAGGQMPSLQDVYTALVAAKSPAAELARGGSIVVTGTRTRESIWAYEANAITQGGWVASQNGVEKLTAADLNRRLAGR